MYRKVWVYPGAMFAALVALFAVAMPPDAGAACMPEALRSKLSEVSQRFGPVSVVSAHRPGARIAGSGRMSYHASCRAVDFNPPPGKYKEVVAWLAQNHSGGLGTYSCGMHHIHIDTGPRVRFHKCQGGGKFYAKVKSSKNRYAYNSKKRRGQYASAKPRGTIGSAAQYSKVVKPSPQRVARAAGDYMQSSMRGYN